LTRQVEEEHAESARPLPDGLQTVSKILDAADVQSALFEARVDVGPVWPSPAQEQDAQLDRISGFL
jgi:hypothetical protein